MTTLTGNRVVLFALCFWVLFISYFSRSYACINGKDDRIELYAADPGIKELASSVVFLTNKNFVEQPSAGYNYFELRPYKNLDKLCPGERFVEQDRIFGCTGVLIAPDLVLTAAHCMRQAWLGCNELRIGFGFAMRDAGDTTYRRVPIEDMYSCKKVETISPRSFLGLTDDHMPDYAVIRLDRPVLNRTPLELNRGVLPSPGDPLILLGYNGGTPLKVMTGTVQRSVLDVFGNPVFLRTDFDTFHGSSGAPVINLKTWMIEGIHASSDDDVEKSGGCFTEKHLEHGLSYETISHLIPRF